MTLLIGQAWESSSFTCLSHPTLLLLRCPNCRSITCPKCRETCFGCKCQLPHFFAEPAASA